MSKIEELQTTLTKFGLENYLDSIKQKIENLTSIDIKIKDQIYDFIQEIIHYEYDNCFPKKGKYFWETLSDYNIRDTIAQITSFFYPKLNFPKEGSGILGKYDQTTVDDAVKELNSQGYHIYKTCLSEEICDSILKKLDDVVFRSYTSLHDITGVKPNEAKSNTYFVLNHQSIAELPEIQDLMMDPMFLNIVQDYLKCAPIHVQCNSWWSVNHNRDEADLKISAQHYHQDMTFIKFIKIFIYLKDVKSENGPHVYVPGSMLSKKLHLPEDYVVSSRVSDEFILEKYGKEGIKEMTGKKGTILFEDTSGYHKGKSVDKGHRVLVQLEYTPTLFNGIREQITENHVLRKSDKFSQKFIEFTKKYPRMFSMHFRK